jgi:hypothetical protein
LSGAYVNTGVRAKNDKSCALCPNQIEPYRWNAGSVLCETCHKEHSPVNAYVGWTGGGEVMFYGCVGSGFDSDFMIIRNTDDVFLAPTQYGKTQYGNKKANA